MPPGDGDSRSFLSVVFCTLCRLPRKLHSVEVDTFLVEHSFEFTIVGFYVGQLFLLLSQACVGLSMQRRGIRV